MTWVYKFLLVVLVFVAVNPASCVQQQDKQSNKPPDLSKFSADQLKRCFDQLKICGADNIYEIEDEFKQRLQQFSTEQLLACFDDWKICGLGEGMADGWPISDELARRENSRRFWIIIGKLTSGQSEMELNMSHIISIIHRLLHL